MTVGALGQFESAKRNLHATVEEFAAETGASKLRSNYLKLNTTQISSSHAGASFFRASEETLNFRWIIRELKEKHGDKQAIIEEFFQNFGQMVQTLVQTPHPTEIVDINAVRHFEPLRRLIIENFAGIASDDLSEDKKKDLLEKIGNFDKRVKRPKEKNLVKEELTESYLGAEKAYYAIDMVVASITKAFMEENVIGKPAEIVPEFRKHRFLRLHSWFLADNDSKPLPFDDMVDNVRSQKEAINRIYTMDLAAIAAKLKETGDSDALNQARITMWRMMETITSISDKALAKYDQIVDRLRELGVPESTLSEIDFLMRLREETSVAAGNVTFLHNKIKASIKKLETIDEKKRPQLEQQIENDKSRLKDYIQVLNSDILTFAETYGDGRFYLRFDTDAEFSKTTFTHDSEQALFDDLEQLRLSCNGNAPTKNIEGVDYSMIDLLEIRATNFGERAQSAEYRQNSGAVNLAFAELLNHLLERKLIDESETSPETLLRIMRDPERASRLRREIGKILSEDFKDVIRGLAADAKLKGKDIPQADRQRFYFGDIMIKLGIIQEEPEAYPVCLIAECKGANDLFQLLFMMKLVTTPEQEKRQMPYSKIVPLSEDPESISHSKEMLHRLLNNPDYMAAVGNKITLMYAGSDSIKSGGIAIKRIIDKLYETLNKSLQAGQEVEFEIYNGTGSAAYRSSVIMSFYRTRQGIEMRLNGAEDVATEIERNFARKMAKQCGFTYKEKLENRDNIIELSNYLAGRDAEKDPELEAANESRIDSYVEKYKSLFFGAFTDILPAQFEKIISFALRPPYRASYNTSGPDMNESGPEKFRAIGYGMVLAHSGWGPVHLYYDASDVLKSDDSGYLENANVAVARYTNDSKLRDSINRGAHSLALSDPDLGLKYIGLSYTGVEVTAGYNNNKLQFTLRSAQGVTVLNAEEFFTSYSDKTQGFVAPLLQNINGHYQKKGMSNDEISKTGKETAFAIMGAMFTYWENLKARRSIGGLIAKMNGETGTDNPSPLDILEGLKKLHPQLGAEMEERREYLDTAREYTFNQFSNYKAEETSIQQLPIDKAAKDKQLKDLTNLYKNDEDLYLALATTKQIYESPFDVTKNPELYSARFNPAEINTSQNRAA